MPFMAYHRRPLLCSSVSSLSCRRKYRCCDHYVCVFKLGVRSTSHATRGVLYYSGWQVELLLRAWSPLVGFLLVSWESFLRVSTFVLYSTSHTLSCVMQYLTCLWHCVSVCVCSVAGIISLSSFNIQAGNQLPCTHHLPHLSWFITCLVVVYSTLMYMSV